MISHVEFKKKNEKTKQNKISQRYGEQMGGCLKGGGGRLAKQVKRIKRYKPPGI